ncbi:MAG: YbhB/YbcL family Raf kinase inhibitor-like protein [Bacteroidota bacterium]
MNSPNFSISSPAFSNGGMIPAKFTCDGLDESPALEWSDPPAGTKSFVLICDDPDAPNGDWVHWVLFNLPSDARSLPEGLTIGTELPEGTLSGVNSWRNTGYGGPCPPSGTHRYFFRLYALGTTLDLRVGATKKEVESAMKGNVLGTAEVMGKYARQ